jgi:hypothetical protein
MLRRFVPTFSPSSFFLALLFAVAYLFRVLAPTQHAYLCAFVASMFALSLYTSAGQSPLTEGWDRYAALFFAAAVLIIAGKVGWDVGYKEGYKVGAVDALDPDARLQAERIDEVRNELERRRGSVQK